MTTPPTTLEHRYRRWLRCYPRAFRQEHGAEMLEVLLAGATDGQRRPSAVECLDLSVGGLRARVRPRVPPSDPATRTAVWLLVAGAGAQLVACITILATMGAVRSAMVALKPRYTAARWHAVVAGRLDPAAVGAGLAIVFWLAVAWATGRRHRWPAVAFAAFFGFTSARLGEQLARGTVVYARADVVAGVAVWLVEVAVLAAFIDCERRRPGARSNRWPRVGGMASAG